MRIGELAERTGVDQRLLRYYEQQGLLHPARRPNGYRDYQETEVGVVRWIRRLLAAGLSTATIAELQGCAREGGPRPAGSCRRLRARLGAERARIDAAIAELATSRAALDELIAAAGNGR